MTDELSPVTLATEYLRQVGFPMAGLRIWCSPSSKGTVLNLTRTRGADSWTGIGYLRDGLTRATEAALVQLDAMEGDRLESWGRDRPSAKRPKRRGYR